MIKKYYIYILYSSLKERYYVGQTDNLDNRLERHNQGKVKSTKYGVPWKLVHKIKVETRSEAVLLERKIKKRGAKRFIDNQFGV